MPQASQSLKHRNSPLASASEQLQVLTSTPTLSRFARLISDHAQPQLQADGIKILQVNVGKMCNMTCRHCHVDAGPDRREIMTRETIDLCLDAIRNSDIRTVDLTGGAPEMNPDFRYFVTQARQLGAHVIDRCNLTILQAPGYEDLAQFLANNQVEIVASLPCYLPENTDMQRGDGAYQLSIEAIQRLNALGYGMPDQLGTQTTESPPSPGRLLTLVFNPIGPSLPPNQQLLEERYREHLRREYGIEFNRLFTITNMPISRFLEDLIEGGNYESYMQTLIDAFNPAALQGVMCRQMISVGWDGQLFDCDFNQMLELPTDHRQPHHIRDFDLRLLGTRFITTGQHCFGCTAGNGSGCLGAIENKT